MGRDCLSCGEREPHPHEVICDYCKEDKYEDHFKAGDLDE
jgi:hypothetical protein